MTGSDASELLRPTIPTRTPGIDPRARPWRLRSQLYVAFLGGILAVTVVAWVNSRRIGVSRNGSRLIAVTGITASLLAAAIGAWMLSGALPPGTPSGARMDPGVRLAYRGASVALYVLFQRIQAKRDRLYGVNCQRPEGEEYSSLWGPGAAASIAGSAVQFLLTMAALALLPLRR